MNAPACVVAPWTVTPRAAGWTPAATAPARPVVRSVFILPIQQRPQRLDLRVPSVVAFFPRLGHTWPDAVQVQPRQHRRRLPRRLGRDAFLQRQRRQPVDRVNPQPRQHHRRLHVRHDPGRRHRPANLQRRHLLRQFDRPDPLRRRVTRHVRRPADHRLDQPRPHPRVPRASRIYARQQRFHASCRDAAAVRMPAASPPPPSYLTPQRKRKNLLNAPRVSGDAAGPGARTWGTACRPLHVRMFLCSGSDGVARGVAVAKSLFHKPL